MSLPEPAPETAAPARQPMVSETERRAGIAAALGAYLLWGFLPLLFRLLDGVPAAVIVAERTLWSLLLVGVILHVTRRFAEVRALIADRRQVRVLLVSALLLAGNWLLYVWAVETEQVLEASFGYFINPLVNVAIGMVLLGERQNRWQAVAILIALAAILVQAIGIGGVPVIALGLALSFGFYSYLRKTVPAGSSTGLFAETLIMAPLAIVYLGFVATTSGLGFHADPGITLLLMLTGPATAVPLLLFAYGVRRLRLTTMGMLQYIGPTLQFAIAIFVFGEEINALRLVSFALIWVSLAVFSADAFRQRRTLAGH